MEVVAASYRERIRGAPRRRPCYRTTLRAGSLFQGVFEFSSFGVRVEVREIQGPESWLEFYVEASMLPGASFDDILAALSWLAVRVALRIEAEYEYDAAGPLEWSGEGAVPKWVRGPAR